MHAFWSQLLRKPLSERLNIGLVRDPALAQSMREPLGCRELTATVSISSARDARNGPEDPPAKNGGSDRGFADPVKNQIDPVPLSKVSGDNLGLYPMRGPKLSCKRFQLPRNENKITPARVLMPLR